MNREANLKASIEEEARTSLLQAVDEVYYWGGGIWMEDDAEMANIIGLYWHPRQNLDRKVDYSGTNNQEQGVDEADFVKTNGYNIFFVDDGVYIMDIPEFGEIEHASTTPIQGNPVAMLLNEDVLVVVSTVSSWNIEDDHSKMQWAGMELVCGELTH